MRVSDVLVRLKELSDSVFELVDSGFSEEDTKRKIIEPFFGCFGWDFRDYGEISVTMEAPTGARGRGEKPDYAFKIKSESVFLVEAKPVDEPLSEIGRDQLRSYMKLDSCKFGVLTNGRKFEFFSTAGRDINIFHTLNLDSGSSISNNDIERILWLIRDFWDIWLVLGTSAFERTIETLSATKPTVMIEAELEPFVTAKSPTRPPAPIKAPRGAATPQKEFQEKIIEILRKKNGISGADIINRIYAIYQGRFNEWDLGRVPSGDVRWKNRVWFALQNLKESGAIKLEDHLYYVTR